MKSYGVITRSYGVITRSYRREREGEGEGEREGDEERDEKGEREREGIRTIGLDWLGRGWRGGCLVLKGIAAGLVFSAWPSPHLSPHSSPPNSFSSPPSTSI